MSSSDDAGVRPSGSSGAPRGPSADAPALRVRRLPEKQVNDRAALETLLDSALVAHIGLVDPPTTGHYPLVVPVAFARVGERLLVHGSTASRAFRALAGGIPVCVTVTTLHGLVVARSQFESSMHYRTAMIFGRFTALEGRAKTEALAALSARLLQGLEGAREPSAQEARATAVLELPLDRWSVKISAGEPDDVETDLDRPVWAGVVPLEHRWGKPIPASNLAGGHHPPDTSVWRQGQT